MKTGLIDEYRFLVHPIVMGWGKRFFKDETVMTVPKLVDTKVYPSGVIVLSYSQHH